MYYSERQMQILEMLQKDKSMTVHRLAHLLCISESSIRRDLTALESLGKIRRTFGGAVLFDAAEPEVPLFYRRSQRLKEKTLIAQKAIAHLSDGMLIFLDASSSAAQIVPFLEGFHDLTVVTNSPATSIALGEANICNYCTGGMLLNHSVAYVGSGAVRFVERFNADAMFFSCRGIDDDGVLSDSQEDEVVIRSAMLERAHKKIFLCDRSKFGLSFHHRLCHRRDLDDVISED